MNTRRHGLAATAALLGGALLLTACGGDASGQDKDSGDGKNPAAVDGATIRITPEDRSDNASINATAVKVSGGKLTEVELTTAQDGQEVPGKISADGKSWKPADQLERATQYELTATARDTKGRESTQRSTFTTVSPDNSFIGSFVPENGSTVGVGMPVSFTFDKAITDRKAVQSGIKVSSSSGQEVVGHWFNGQRLDFRPEEYWEAGSKVTVKIALDGVEGTDGVYGVQDKTVSFIVGRSQVSTVDVATQTMKVVRDGADLKTLPISAGAPESPTYNGQMVISEKYLQTRMNGDTVGFDGQYDISNVPHAMRLSTSGTFVHGNYWYDRGNPPFGRAGTSHGCVGLADVEGARAASNGKWFYDESLIGDVVIVKGSPDKTITPDNGLNGWNMAWTEWKAGSAA
ncbi:Ig-like domain-containing protein [Streptomyces sp. GC420]|uniref:L,D-transpeptidase n=1 Tax=Streptomyces sp. GC420 TaxID=2697568 RepID=UPI001414EB26|nr:Ig-like domain-containing protein [Streptomyces sp. GC420]NBM18861.1 L,D-transpeptidase family protein [Streptomyces sp. GC420]